MKPKKKIIDAAKFQRWIDKINKKENESINRMKGNVK